MIERKKQGAVDILTSDDALRDRDLEEARNLFEQCVAAGIPKVVFNLGHVPLLNSAALEMLLDFRDQCAKRGGLFKISNASTLPADILRVTGVTETIELFDDEVHAVGSYAQ